MPFRSNVDFDSDHDKTDLPLTLAKINLLGEYVEKKCRELPEYRVWVAVMGTRPHAWNLLFCGDTAMRQYQKRFRKLNRTTDVLSFPAIENKQLRGLYLELYKKDRSLGDVVVSLEAVARGARRGRRPIKDELKEVLVHAFLHLLGFDHVVKKGLSPVRARRMRQIQKTLYQSLPKTI